MMPGDRVRVKQGWGGHNPSHYAGRVGVIVEAPGRWEDHYIAVRLDEDPSAHIFPGQPLPCTPEEIEPE